MAPDAGVAVTTFAVIPARSGSTRLPGKNLLEVGGRSLLVRALESAIDCDVTVVTGGNAENDHVHDWVLKNTHPNLIHNFCRNPHLLDGPLEPVILEALTLAAEAQPDDLVVLLQPTSPFRTATHVREAVELAKTSGRSVVSVCRDGRPAYFGGRAVCIDNIYAPSAAFSRAHPKRVDTQRMDDYRYENGAIYVTTVRSLVEHYDRAHDPVWYDMSQVASVDVDTHEDLAIARALHDAGLQDAK